ncbi:MAG: AMP-binding protein, partial [Candidatus Aminicenantes bacterium]|nr:AMP-binding protein [Candidatus Aminicenantes bacterium]NIQ69766.1 AMP-binding protein [Candidatus Aminicenantes bacterium]NIT25786.1 AMP-binding protein [Candidatus Aminicenantes bacterium]
SFIGILLDDRVELITVILGILKAGSVFVPLDTIIPVNRLEKRIKHANIQTIFTDTRNKERLLSISQDGQTRLEVILIDESFYRKAGQSFWS